MDLACMKYAQLQKLAKKHGIKANQKVGGHDEPYPMPLPESNEEIFFLLCVVCLSLLSVKASNSPLPPPSKWGFKI